jgi:cell division protein FtsN
MTTPATKIATGAAADDGRYRVAVCGTTSKTPKAPRTTSQAWRSSTPAASTPATVARASTCPPATCMVSWAPASRPTPAAKYPVAAGGR